MMGVLVVARAVSYFKCGLHLSPIYFIAPPGHMQPPLVVLAHFRRSCLNFSHTSLSSDPACLDRSRSLPFFARIYIVDIPL